MAGADPTGSSDATKSLIYIADHADRAVNDLLLAQFRDLPRWNALIRGLAAGVQLMEDQLFALCVDMQLDSAAGAQLDKWGALVGEQRGPLGDEDYRRFIQARILVNISGGTPDELICIWAIITGADTVHLFNQPPACLTLQATRSSLMADEVVRRVVRMMQDAKPAGVCMVLVEALTGYFGFQGDPEALGYGVGPYSRRLL